MLAPVPLLFFFVCFRFVAEGAAGAGAGAGGVGASAAPGGGGGPGGGNSGGEKQVPLRAAAMELAIRGTKQRSGR